MRTIGANMSDPTSHSEFTGPTPEVVRRLTGPGEMFEVAECDVGEGALAGIHQRGAHRARHSSQAASGGLAPMEGNL